jgi:hypothetical protein
MKKAKMAIGSPDVGAIKFLLFTLTSMLGKLIPLSFPLFALSDYRLVYKIQKGTTFHMEDGFEGAKSTKHYWVTLQFILYMECLMIVVLGLIFMLYLSLNYIGSELDNLMNFNRYYTAWFFQITSIVFAVIAIYNIGLSFAPVVYIVSNQDEPNLSEALKDARKMMTPQAKMKLIEIHFLHVVRFLPKLLIGAALAYYAVMNFQVILYLIVIIVVSIALLFSLPKYLLSIRISSVHLFDSWMEGIAYTSLFDGTNQSDYNQRIQKEEVLLKLFEDITPTVEGPTTVEVKEGL